MAAMTQLRLCPVESEPGVKGRWQCLLLVLLLRKTCNKISLQQLGPGAVLLKQNGSKNKGSNLIKLLVGTKLVYFQFCNKCQPSVFQVLY